MENQTGFDLNRGIEKWRHELAAQATLNVDVRRELETHLRDSVADLQSRGLDLEESFWLARRRVGTPQDLAEEFAKEDPSRVWRERLFWMILGVFAVQFWFDLAPYTWELMTRPFTWFLRRNHGQLLPDWVLYYVPFPSASDLMAIFRSPIARSLFSLLPVVCFAVLLGRGRLHRAASALRFAFRSRRRFVWASVALFAIYGGLVLSVLLDYASRNPTPVLGNPSVRFVVQASIARLTFGVVMVGLIAWLMPGARKRLKAKD